MSRRIFITGSGGIVGRHALTALKTLAPDAEVLRNTADLTNPHDVAQVIERAGPLDLVIHLAAMVPVQSVRANPGAAFAINAGGTINLLTALDGSAARMLLCSSSHVYASQETPLRETDATEPVSLYGQTKLMSEQAAQQICAATGRSLCIARLFSIHDPEQTGSYLRPTLEKRFATHSPEAPFELYGAGSRRDFLPASEAARLITELALSEAEGPVNVASGNAMTVADFAQAIAPFPLNIRPVGQNDTLEADVTRLRAILGERHD
ncbi:NAD-dependent epimerase/dehydratase family protein [Phaeobacter piscinae]|uniref:NAD-dependent epimerase/dehydratase family protein n=1 Tax=Phaeobacter piscinae TaxID=1580596 RepID=UPI000C9C5C72|nr:NAD(P)-dependent oxidoreductase [Phaeobacter piscinae]AUQ75731.1 putative NAD dependent epimerase/dehydratase [Phaeobacter piscinae]